MPEYAAAVWMVIGTGVLDFRYGVWYFGYNEIDGRLSGGEGSSGQAFFAERNRRQQLWQQLY